MLAYATAGIAPAPSPWSARPTTTTHIAGASPETSSPAAKTTIPAANGPAGPCRSTCSPATTSPTSVPRKNALVTQP